MLYQSIYGNNRGVKSLLFLLRVNRTLVHSKTQIQIDRRRVSDWVSWVVCCRSSVTTRPRVRFRLLDEGSLSRYSKTGTLCSGIPMIESWEEGEIFIQKELKRQWEGGPISQGVLGGEWIDRTSSLCLTDLTRQWTGRRTEKDVRTRDLCKGPWLWDKSNNGLYDFLICTTICTSLIGLEPGLLRYWVSGTASVWIRLVEKRTTDSTPGHVARCTFKGIIHETLNH